MSSRISRFCVCLVVAVGALIAVGGCTGEQAALRPASPQAQHIRGLISLYLVIVTIVYIATVAMIVLGFWRRHKSTPDHPDPPVLAPDPLRERRHGIVVAAAVGITTIILLVLLISDFLAGRALAAPAGDPDALKIRIVGHQWWWELVYYGQDPSDTFTAANEIHIPVGRTIRFELQAADVIHSFWVPRLHGKKDLIPGHSADLYLKADKEGTYFGQCAEFCGWQHARMRLVVVAEPNDRFEAWRSGQLRAAAEPGNEVEHRGKAVFLSSTCMMCHAVRGTTAGARLGPDLTHLASRRFIAANTIPNMPGHLAGWIVDPQKLKPGVRMPQNSVPPSDLRALLEYLESLK